MQSGATHPNYSTVWEMGKRRPLRSSLPSRVSSSTRSALGSSGTTRTRSWHMYPSQTAGGSWPASGHCTTSFRTPPTTRKALPSPLRISTRSKVTSSGEKWLWIFLSFRWAGLDCFHANYWRAAIVISAGVDSGEHVCLRCSSMTECFPFPELFLEFISARLISDCRMWFIEQWKMAAY